MSMRYGEVLAVVCLITLAGCEWFSFNKCCSHCSGTVIRQERVVPAFEEIAISGRGTLRVSQGEKASLMVEADQNLMPHIITEVHDGVLHVYTHTTCACSHEKVPATYYASINSIKKISVSGDVIVQAPELRAEDLVIEASDASKVEAQVYAHYCHIKGSGSPAFTLGGSVESSRIDIAGNGTYNAVEMENKTCELFAAGTSHVTMNVNSSLTINAYDDTVVEYKGNPSLGIRSSGLSIKNIGV